MGSPSPHKLQTSVLDYDEDTYIADLEEAGRMFQRATEHARAGRPKEAVPLFKQSLREFERLDLPDLQQIQDEIGHWLSQMERRIPPSSGRRNYHKKPEEQDEFYSPMKESGAGEFRGQTVGRRAYDAL